MSHYYQELDRPGGFDYRLFKLPEIEGKLFRGPAVDRSVPYLACLGAAQTFGRFAHAPFPALLGERLGIPALNLGVGGAGPRLFATGPYLKLINGAEAAIVQILSGRSASNSLFDNSVSDGMTGRVRSDQSTMRADDFFARLTVQESPSKIEQIVEETRNDYVEGFIRLLRSIAVPKILFWFSTRAPDYSDRYDNLPSGVLGAFPQLVNREMVEELKGFADAYAECVASAGLPQPLWPAGESIDGAVSSQGMLMNRYYPSPAMHVSAADALEGPCRRFLGSHKIEGLEEPAKRFVIVAAERTGTNLLIGMLNDYSGCYVGGELFNPHIIADDTIPWDMIGDADQRALLDLRKRDPVSFWQTLCTLTVEKGYYTTVGFKLLYTQGVQQANLLEHLVEDTALRVIHLKRRNLLRRFVSARQAAQSNKWAVDVGTIAPRKHPVRVTAADIVSSFHYVDEHQAAYDAKFSNHPVLELIYEDLAERPLHVAERTARFLGLRTLSRAASVKTVKTGANNLPDAIVDYNQLRAKFRRWASFFDE